MTPSRLAWSATLVLSFLLSAFAGELKAQAPSPREHFGFGIGDDYRLANYTRTEAWFRKLAAGSDRVHLVEIGQTSEGRSQLMLVVSSPANLARLDEYRVISERLARARDDEATARQLSAAGKAVVWIDGGLHATETVGSHQLIQTAWELASSDDPEMMRILDDTIVLLVHANPDGQELIADWYMREPRPARRVLEPAPRMYQKYAGHDNNRDFYMAALQETRNLNRIAYLEWYPQILYNHHQTSPRGTVIVIPPYRDPFNYAYDPLVPVGLEALGSAMNSRFLLEGKPGAVSKGGSTYSTWWNGGLRTTPYFHNMLGILTEITGNPTPMEIPFLANRQLPDGNLPAPVPPQKWHFRQSIEYSVSANRAVLDYASRHREQLLFNIWKMGRNSIERGSHDHWTPSPSALDALRGKDDGERAGEFDPARQALLHARGRRDPRAWVVPSDQPDFPTAVKFINALQLAGVEVHRAPEAVAWRGRKYPAGSYFVRAAQAFRPHVLDMFEPQDHPHDFEYPGGPPVAPYDSAGWTLAFQMGVRFDRLLDSVDKLFDGGKLQPVALGRLQVPDPGKVPDSPVGWAIPPAANDAFTVVNALLKQGVGVARDAQGRFIVAAEGQAYPALAAQAVATGVSAEPLAQLPDGRVPLRAPRIALWDHYGGSMVSGWTRLVLESFGFDYTVVYPAQIESGSLRGSFDVLILPSGALPIHPSLAIEGKGARKPRKPDPARIPAEYRNMLGELDLERSLPALRDFLEAGGHVVATGSSASLAVALGLPVSSHLRTSDGQCGLRPLRQREYYIPGSVLQVAVDTRHAAARGLPPRLDLYFSDGRWDNAPVFDLAAAEGRVQPILWFEDGEPLRSGWAWGQHYLENGVLGAEARVGDGVLTFFGTDVTFRSQSHGAFKLLFNSLMRAGEDGLEEP